MYLIPNNITITILHRPIVASSTVNYFITIQNINCKNERKKL